MSTPDATAPRRAQPMTERQLASWYGRHSPAETAQRTAEGAVWQTLRARFGAAPELQTASLDLDDLEGDAIAFYERRLLLLVGSLCLKNGQRALWSAIWAACAPGPPSPGEAFAFLEEATAAARAGEL